MNAEQEQEQETAAADAEAKKTCGCTECPVGGADNAEGASEPTLSDAERIAALECEAAELKDQLLRKAADFDNYRKRMIREKQEAFDYANANLLGDLLDSLDNMDRALEAAASSSDSKTVIAGVEMTKKQLVSMLETRYSLESFGAKGDPFDPTAHEAIASAEAEVAEATCAEVYLKGYKLKERVIRHAKVLVHMPKSGATDGGNEGAESTADGGTGNTAHA